MKKIVLRDWSEESKPREKLMYHGAKSLSDTELLAILLRTGSRQETAIDLAVKILSSVGGNIFDLGQLAVKDLTNFEGMGKVKAVSILAGIELGRRCGNIATNKIQISSSRQAYLAIHENLTGLEYEEFWILCLDRANQLIKKYRISKGGISGTVADSKIIFKQAIVSLSSSIILCHNHPSGQMKPSKADIQITEKLKEMGQLFDIPVVDHIIVGDNRYFSFADKGLL